MNKDIKTKIINDILKRIEENIQIAIIRKDLELVYDLQNMRTKFLYQLTNSK